MGAQRHLLPCFLILLSIFSSYAQAEAQTSYFSRALYSVFSRFSRSKINQNLVIVEEDDDCEAPTFQTFSVDDFGARGDGSDDTEAFRRAWEATCSTEGAALLVPLGRSYIVRPIKFSGPCKSRLKVQIAGAIVAPADVSVFEDNRWLVFDGVDDLTVEGGGTINGNGNVWWECKKSKSCKDAPTALIFHGNKNLVVQNLRIQDAQQMHLTFDGCVNVQVFGLMVIAPEDSPNTDGIHVSNTQNIKIIGCTIGTGDDCISIVSGSDTVLAQDITCGPGHGISIGSLGKDGSEDHVSNVIVDGARLVGTQNGARIKTWQGGSGIASDIRFLNMQMDNVKNPIIIDQNYCDKHDCPSEQESAVQVQNVLYQNIKGTSATDVAIKLDCSRSHPCLGIVLKDINLGGGGGGGAAAECNSVAPNISPDVFPACVARRR